ncbi:MAG: NAD(P)/FAD-dependent oxidoreductase [Pseudomonadota bacterium]
MQTIEHFDVIVVGAGLSGIGAGYHLQAKCPDKSYLILEGREAMGGTWDLFRYPGIRSDSDMYTLGYSFKPWTNPKAIADGPSILAYIRETAEEYGVDEHIRYNLHVDRAVWSSSESQWSIEAENTKTGETARFTCGFLFMCSGYYNYAKGYTPEFEGTEQFQGQIVHPQKWTDDIDYAGKKVVVIGSGATAVTLVPEMAKTAEHVTMLQRSPTYVVSMPAEDRIANGLRKFLPAKFAYSLTRWKNVLMGLFFFRYIRRNPERVKNMLINGVKQALGPDYDVDTHFTPRYNPWDQRLCLIPDGDMFQMLKASQASVVTDHIEAFTETGIKLKSGKELEADLVVTATGLDLQVISDLNVTVDSRKIDFSEKLLYKGMMCSDIPNFAFAMGYTNASWTLKCDLTCEYVCRLINYMERKGYASCLPKNEDPSVLPEPLLDFSSGYVQRSIHKFPKQGSKAPWRLYQNYALDTFNLGYKSLDNGIMEFSKPGQQKTAPSVEDAEAMGIN